MQWYEGTSKKLEVGYRYSHQDLIRLLKSDYPQMSESSYHWAVCGMLKSGSLTKIARNVYVVQNERKKPVYRPAYSDLAAKLISQVSDKYPSVHFTVFETALMNDFLNHLVAQNTVYIQICLANGIGVVPFSPVASGFLSGKVTAQTSFEHIDDVRKFVPQLSRENMTANQPVLDLLEEVAQRKQATKAQISMAWMLKKYPNVVPIPGSKHQERILENLAASEVTLTDEEFRSLEERLDQIPVYGHRGNVEFDGSKMSDWGKKK